jgi:hypothetical protein
MAGEADHRDPADIARERQLEVAKLVKRAEVAEDVVSGMSDPKNAQDVAVMTQGLVTANNMRLRALCIHLRLPTLEVNGEEQA